MFVEKVLVHDNSHIFIINMEGSINIAFVGDIMPGGVFVRTGGVEKEVQDYLSSFDLRVGTLESAFGDGTTLCHIKNTPKLGTIIFTPDERIKMLLDLGINAVSLANNHSCDCDLSGLYHTIDLLDKYGISHFGAGHTDEEAAAPAVIRCKGKTICLLGYLQEYEYLYRGAGYVPTDNTGGINLFALDKVLKDVKQYKEIYDYVFVMPHWGTEGSVYPKIQEVKYAHKIIAAGADGVIGSHAHIVQPVWKYRKKVIAMNLGNFAFPDRYVVKPRISYYPTDEELRDINIPVVNSFKLVDTLSYKKVAKTERRGMILSVVLNSDNIVFKQYFTELLEDNTIVYRDKPSFIKMTPFYLKCLLRDSAKFVYHNSKLLHKLRTIKSK